MPLRIVLDTNTVISALLWGGKPGRVLNAVYSHHAKLCASPFLLREFSRTLAKRKFEERLNVLQASHAALENHYQKLVAVIEPEFVPEVILSHPPDNHILACALKAKADVIVSGDAHLKALKSYMGIPIVNSAGFLAEYLPPEK